MKATPTPRGKFGSPANYNVWPPTNTGLIQPSPTPWGSNRPLSDANAFEYFFHHLMKWEGGYNLRSPKADPGGATKYGVTWSTCRAAVIAGHIKISGFGHQTPNNQSAWIPAVKALTEAQAKEIAKKMFWSLTAECVNPYCRVIITQVLWGSWTGGLFATTGQRTIKDACTKSTFTAGNMIPAYLGWLQKLPNARQNPGWWGRMYDMQNEFTEAAGGLMLWLGDGVKKKGKRGIII